MKKKILSLFVILPIFACAQRLPDDIAKIIRKRCDSVDVFTTIIRSKKLNIYFPKEIFAKFYDKEQHKVLVDDPRRKSAFIQNISKFYGSSKNQMSILRLINGWCAENDFINNIADKFNVPAEAIFYYDKRTRFLVRKFIAARTLPGQDWTSLATYELYELNIDYLNYVDGLSENEKRDLHDSLMKVAKKHSNEG